MRGLLWAVAGLCLAGCSLLPGAAGNPESVRVLAERLLASGAPGDIAVVTVGRLPPEMPADTPVPDGAAVLGGVRRSFDRQQNVDAVIDVPSPPDATISALKLKFRAAGWRAPELGAPGGIASSDAVSATFCKTQDGPLLIATARRTRTGGSELRYALTDFKSKTFSPCAGPLAAPPSGTQPKLPDLIPPDDARVIPAGGGGGPNFANSQAYMETALQPADLRAHFDAQLTHAGWIPKAEGHADTFAWSTWAYKDADGLEQYGLLFVALQEGTPVLKLVYLHGTFATGG